MGVYVYKKENNIWQRLPAIMKNAYSNHGHLLFIHTSVEAS